MQELHEGLLDEEDDDEEKIDHFQDTIHEIERARQQALDGLRVLSMLPQQQQEAIINRRMTVLVGSSLF